MFEELVCIVSGLLEVLLFLSVFRYCDASKDGIGAGSGPTDEDAVGRRRTRSWLTRRRTRSGLARRRTRSWLARRRTRSWLTTRRTRSCLSRWRRGLEVRQSLSMTTVTSGGMVVVCCCVYEDDWGVGWEAGCWLVGRWGVCSAGRRCWGEVCGVWSVDFGV